MLQRPDHFPSPYMHNLFFSKIFKLGVYISRTSNCTNSIVVTPEDLSSIREDWIDDGHLLRKDRVHLTRQGVNNARDLIRKAFLYWWDYNNSTLTPTYPILSLRELLTPGGREFFLHLQIHVPCVLRCRETQVSH